VSFDQTLAQEPTYDWVWNEKGAVLGELERNDEALEAFRQAAQLRPDEVWYWHNQLLLLRPMERYDEALIAAQSMIDASPRLFIGWSWKGQILNHLERHEESVQAFNRALELEPVDGWTLNAKARALFDLERPEEAFASLERATRYKPGGRKDKLFVQGLHYISKKQFKEALPLLERFIRAKPDSAAGWNMLANTYYMLDRSEDALQALDKCLQVDQARADVWHKQALLLQELKRDEAALASSQRAYTLEPDNATYRDLTISLLIDLKRYEEALPLVERVLEHYSDHKRAWTQKGQLLRLMKRYDEALVVFNHILSLNPAYLDALIARSVIYYNTGDFERAIADNTQVLQNTDLSASRVGMMHNNRGEAYFALGQHAQALADFQKALELRPDFEYAIAGIAVSQHALGQPQEAAQHWQSLLAKDANYRSAEWVKEHLNWNAALVDEARKLIAHVE
jgi:tetratricopeptide (TPR) repeat protein